MEVRRMVGAAGSSHYPSSVREASGGWKERRAQEREGLPRNCRSKESSPLGCGVGMRCAESPRPWESRDSYQHPPSPDDLHTPGHTSPCERPSLPQFSWQMERGRFHFVFSRSSKLHAGAQRVFLLTCQDRSLEGMGELL